MVGRRAARPGELGKVSYTQTATGEWVARARTRDAGGREARPQGRAPQKTPPVPSSRPARVNAPTTLAG